MQYEQGPMEEEGLLFPKITLAGKWTMGWVREEMKETRQEEVVTQDRDDGGWTVGVTVEVSREHSFFILLELYAGRIWMKMVKQPKNNISQFSGL